jgi:hypothetical protein
VAAAKIKKNRKIVQTFLFTKIAHKKSESWKVGSFIDIDQTICDFILSVIDTGIRFQRIFLLNGILASAFLWCLQEGSQRRKTSPFLSSLPFQVEFQDKNPSGL